MKLESTDAANSPHPSNDIEPNHSSTSAATDYAPFSKRALFIGMILCPLLVFWGEYTEIVAQGADLIAMSLVMAVMFAFIVMLIVNGVIRKISPKNAFTQAEMMFIYTLNSASIGIAGIGMMQFLVPNLTGPYYFQNPNNGWSKWMFLLKSWAMPDKSVVQDYYLGHSSFFTPEHIAGWVSPIIVWSIFIFVLLYCMYCIGTLLRRQWVESERLIFPIAAVPLEITNESSDTTLWKNKVFWLGFAIAMSLQFIDAMHYTIDPKLPWVPLLPSEPAFNMNQYITQTPWTAIGYTAIGFYPLVIGIIYLLSLDISFSCWFFFLFLKVENIASASFGLRDPHDDSMLGSVPYAGNQGVGAFAALAMMAVAGAWPHIKGAFKSAFGKHDGADRATAVDADEPMSYRSAILGLGISAALLVTFGVALGIALPVSIAFFVVFLLYIIAVSRIRAEAGLPWSVGPVPYAHGTLVNIAGSHSFSTPTLVGMSMFRWFDSDWRGVPMPSQMEAMKIAQGARINPRHLTIAIAVGTILATAASWISLLGIYYHFGAASGQVNSWRTEQGHDGYDELTGYLNLPHGFDAPSFRWSLVGALVVVVLGIMRRNFVWWPFHPLGYAVANSISGAPFVWAWMSIFVGWLAKYITLRYGGVQAYRRALPFFIGLILGDYMAGALTSLLYLAFGVHGYRTFPI